MMKKTNTLINGKKSEHLSIHRDDHDESNSLSKEIQTVILSSSSTIKELQGSQPMEPNALTMRKITIDTDSSQIEKGTKVGDGAYIASEDR
jgi:hypothetical protein